MQTICDSILYKISFVFLLCSVVFHAVVPLVATPSKVSAQVPLLDQPWNLEFMPFNLGFTVGCPGTKPHSCSLNMEQWMGKTAYNKNILIFPVLKNYCKLYK